MRLLLVEDDRIYQTFLGGLLQTEAERVGVPLSIEVANSLEEARAATMAHDVDAALLDLNLPDSSRLRTLQDLLNFKPDLPVVVLSAEEDEGLAFDSVTSGAQDYIVKGDEDPRQILRSLQHSIERKRIQEELRRANARYHSDLKAATLVQQSLLPSEPPEGGDLEWAWSFTPASELAGDIYNCFDIDEDTVGCYLVDVSGHGVSAALLAVQVSRVLTPASAPWWRSQARRRVGASQRLVRHHRFHRSVLHRQLRGLQPSHGAAMGSQCRSPAADAGGQRWLGARAQHLWCSDWRTARVFLSPTRGRLPSRGSALPLLRRLDRSGAGRSPTTGTG
jgi:DNA-binding NarL/FixJ family response regulator